MPSFSRVINALAIIIVLGGVVGYFGLGKDKRIFTFIPDSPASDTASLLPTNAARAVTQTPLALQGGAVLQPMDMTAFETLLAKSYNKPVYLMIYASWCPHCKRMFTALNELVAQHDVHIATLSIDNKPQAAQAFAASVIPLRLDTYIIKDMASYREVGDRLRAMGLQFQGGKARSVPVPYNIILWQGAPVAEIGGALPRSRLALLLSEVAKQSR